MTEKPHDQQGFIDGSTVGTLTILLVAAFAIGGYIANICGLVHSLGGPVTAMFIARCVGVFVAPLGAILGFL